ncbi:MAG: glutaminyl-peptide cyclotransferase [Actinomycetia bacterium]|nr:glutaminyl-peptide cyclotransferase [Actinomycetes bacterium]
MGRLVVIPILAGLIVAACSSGTTEPVDLTQRGGTIFSSPTSAAPEANGATTVADPTPTSAPTTVPVGTAPLPLDYTVVATHPHDVDAFTQGLLFWQGRFVESTGERGESDLRVVDPETGDVLALRTFDEPAVEAIRQSVGIDQGLFGEGVALVDDRLIQLTWTAGHALVWDLTSLEFEESLVYGGEGWGLCYDGSRLVMSNGSSFLTFRDPSTFEPTGSVEVTWAGQPVSSLNELECIGGQVWANIWKDNRILVIDPVSGAVSHVLDATDLEPDGVRGGRDVLNGIAHDPQTGRLWLTGKNWPVLYEVAVDLP